jgi:hypothetical protein
MVPDWSTHVSTSGVKSALSNVAEEIIVPSKTI